MQQQEEPTSSSSVILDENFDRDYANRLDLEALPDNIADRMARRGVTTLNLSGSPNLSQFGDLPHDLLITSLRNSLWQESDPLAHLQGNELFSLIKKISNPHESWSSEIATEILQTLAEQRNGRFFPESMQPMLTTLFTTGKALACGEGTRESCQAAAERILVTLNNLQARWRLIEVIKERINSVHSVHSPHVDHVLRVSENYSTFPTIYLKLLQNVTELQVDAAGLTILEGVEHLENLNQITISDAAGLFNLDSFSLNKSVKSLVLRNAVRFVSFNGVASLPGLETLRVDGVRAPIDMQALVGLPTLQSININYPPVTPAGVGYADDDIRNVDEAIRATAGENYRRLEAVNHGRSALGQPEIVPAVAQEAWLQARATERLAAVEELTHRLAAIGALFADAPRVATANAITTIGTGVDTPPSDSDVSEAGFGGAQHRREITTSSVGSDVVNFFEIPEGSI